MDAVEVNRKILFSSTVLVVMAGLLSAMSLFSGSAEFLRGTLIERVACLANPDHSYALVLPSVYTPERRWPVVFCFDPGGLGARPARLLSAAAETYGFIVVASNTVRNGPWDRNIQACRAMWQDCRQRLTLDESRIYACGFSGGARVASIFNQVIGIPLAGIIACGAGLAPGIQPEQLGGTAFFAVVGEWDFNFREMMDLDRKLAEKKIVRRVAIFSGDHRWPPAEMFARALEWLELQAMKSGKIKANPAWLEGVFGRRLAAAVLAEQTDPPQAADALSDLAEDFDGLRDLDSVRDRLSRLENSPVVRAEKRRREQIAVVEVEAQARVQGLVNSILAAADDRLRVLELRHRLDIPALHRDAAKSGDAIKRVVARRLLPHIFSSCYEGGREFFDRGRADLAGLLLEIALEADPGQPAALYWLASSQIQMGEKKKAWQTLRRATASGFDSPETFEQDTRFDGLRHEADYLEILELIRKNSPSTP